MKNTPTYFALPNGEAVAVVLKAGSTSIGNALLNDVYPDSRPHTVGAEAGNAPIWQAFVPKKDDPQDTVHVPIRDVVERFRSGVSQMRRGGRAVEVDDVLTDLETGGKWSDNLHFEPITSYLKASNALYRFPDDNTELAEAIGVTTIPLTNDGETNNPPKPDLTTDQLARVQAIYADDIALYESITTAGQSYTLPSPPATDELKAEKIQELRSARDAVEFGGITFNGLPVQTDMVTQARLTSALSLVALNPSTIIKWEFPDGSIVDLDKATIEALAAAVFGHVQQTRTDFAAAKALVEAATTVEELAAI